MKAWRQRLAAATLLVPLACIAHELDAESLDRVIRGLKSNAQEASLLLASARDGQVTRAYANVQREELRREVRDAAKPLDEKAPAPLTQRAASARALTDRLVAALRDEDAAAAEAAARDLSALAAGK